MADFYFNSTECVAPQRKRVRILYTIPNFDTAGSGKALLNIAIRLNKDEFEPHIMCMHDRGDFFKVVRNSGIPIHLLEYATTMKPYAKGFWRCWKISRHFKEIGPDIIHSFHYSADYSEALAARMAGIKWIYTKKSMSWGGSSGNAWLLRSFLASGIIAQNTDMLTRFFTDCKKVVLIPRGVDVDQFSPGPVNQALRSSYGVEAGERIIICVANLVPVKGVEVLIDAFSGLASEFTRWKVWIVGDDKNEYGVTLRERVFGLSLGDRIIFTGKQPDVKPFLDQAEIFVLPTLNEGRMEGSPVSLLEAMANGKAVIASNVPGIKDQLADFPDCLFLAGSVSDLQEKLRKLMNLDLPAIRFLGTKLASSFGKFSIGIEVERHAATYSSIVNGK